MKELESILASYGQRPLQRLTESSWCCVVISKHPKEFTDEHSKWISKTLLGMIVDILRLPEDSRAEAVKRPIESPKHDIQLSIFCASLATMANYVITNYNPDVVATLRPFGVIHLMVSPSDDTPALTKTFTLKLPPIDNC